MKRLILVYGDLATGKSTFADILSKKLLCPAIKKDSIKEILGDTIGFEGRFENLRLSTATFEIMYYSFERVSLVGSDLILEANFREWELQRLSDLAEERGYTLISLHLTAPTELLYDRYLKRIESGRHPVHLTNGFDDYEGFVKYVTAQRTEKTFGTQIEIDASDFGYQSDEEIFLKIDKATLPSSMYAALEEAFGIK